MLLDSLTDVSEFRSTEVLFQHPNLWPDLWFANQLNLIASLAEAATILWVYITAYGEVKTWVYIPDLELKVSTRESDVYHPSLR